MSIMLPALPASIKTYLEASQQTIDHAHEQIATVKANVKRALDTFYQLEGRFAVSPGGVRFRIERVEYRGDGTVSRVWGPRVRKDGSLSKIDAYLYRFELGSIEVSDA